MRAARRRSDAVASRCSDPAAGALGAHFGLRRLVHAIDHAVTDEPAPLPLRYLLVATRLRHESAARPVRAGFERPWSRTGAIAPPRSRRAICSTGWCRAGRRSSDRALVVYRPPGTNDNWRASATARDEAASR